MLLELAVNDGPSLRASLNRKGWLSAHLNVTIGADEKDDATMSLTSIDETDEPNAVYSTWQAGKLSVGDKVEIRLLAVGEADPPTTVRRSSESPRNLFSDADQARRLLIAINAFDAELMGIMEHARAVEPKEEFDRIVQAIGAVVVEVDQRLISPTLRRHPELLDEAAFKKLWK
jgi:hypothetical protein